MHSHPIAMGFMARSHIYFTYLAQIKNTTQKVVSFIVCIFILNLFRQILFPTSESSDSLHLFRQ